MILNRKKLVDCPHEDKCVYGDVPLDIVENCLRCQCNKKAFNPDGDYREKIKKTGY